MALVLDIHKRTGYLLLAVLLGHVILISAQVPSRSGVRVLEAVTFGVFAEIQRASTGAIGSVRQVWGSYVGLRGVRAENEALRRQVADLQVKLQAEHALAQRSEKLGQLLDLRTRIDLPTIAAAVVGQDLSSDFRTITIDKGTRDGLLPDMAVISPAGVIGRVVLPTARAAKVQLLVGRNAGAGALVERTRAGGVIVGGRPRSGLELDFVSNLADVKPGDLVVTSGIDGIFPKGLLIGRVEAVERGAGLYKTIRVQPAVDFSALEEVLVIVAPRAGDGE
jgi:rod shape-determining protein MreC